MGHLGDITYEVIFPGEALKGFVSHFWCSRWDNSIRQSLNYHATANTNTEAVFAFGLLKQPVFTTLLGHTTHYRCIEAVGLSEMFGVSLHSHAIPYFFGVSADDLCGQLIDLGEIISSDAEVIALRLANCNSIHGRVALMRGYLMSRFDTRQKTDPAILNAIKKIRASCGQVNIANMAKEALLSEKQFERRFRNFSGFNPKLYSRILRFECSLVPYGYKTGFTRKALDLGYYDQAHFIKDFKAFSGFSPGAYTPVSY